MAGINSYIASAQVPFTAPLVELHQSTMDRILCKAMMWCFVAQSIRRGVVWEKLRK